MWTKSSDSPTTQPSETFLPGTTKRTKKTEREPETNPVVLCTQGHPILPARITPLPCPSYTWIKPLFWMTLRLRIVWRNIDLGASHCREYSQDMSGWLWFSFSDWLLVSMCVAVPLGENNKKKHPRVVPERFWSTPIKYLFCGISFIWMPLIWLTWFFLRVICFCSHIWRAKQKPHLSVKLTLVRICLVRAS